MTETKPKNLIEASEPLHVVHMGIDLARKVDYTSVCVLEARQMLDHTKAGILLVRQWERYDREAKWENIWNRAARTAERVIEYMRQDWQEAYDKAALRAMDARYYDPDFDFVPPPPEPLLKVRFDGTGLGDPIGDEILKAMSDTYIPNVRFYPVYFNHGDRIKYEKGAYSLGKAFMVSLLQAHLGSRRLKVSPEIYNAKEALQELEDYQVEVTENMNEKYGAFRVGAHDDMVTSLGLACIDLKPPPNVLQGTYREHELGFLGRK